MKIRDIIPTALGEQPARLLIKNARVLDVFTGELEHTNLAIHRKRIAGIGLDYTDADEVIDAEGRIVVPGFIDAHLHIESSMLVPRQFARAVLSRGTTTVIADPHEIANVLGTAGVEYMLRSTEGIPLDVYIAVPSAVPATRFETSGAYLGTDDMIDLVDRNPKRIIALGEVMNYPAVLGREVASWSPRSRSCAPGTRRSTATRRGCPARRSTPTSAPSSAPTTSAPHPKRPWRRCAAACTSSSARAARRATSTRSSGR